MALLGAEVQAKTRENGPFRAILTVFCPEQRVIAENVAMPAILEFAGITAMVVLLRSNTNVFALAAFACFQIADVSKNRGLAG